MGNACGAGSYPPFWDPRNRERVIEAKIKRAEYEFDEPAWKDISPSAKELISQLMTLDVEKRLTAEECFEDHEHRHVHSLATVIQLWNQLKFAQIFQLGCHCRWCKRWCQPKHHLGQAWVVNLLRTSVYRTEDFFLELNLLSHLLHF